MIATTPNVAPPYSAGCWISNGGSAIAVDNTPNTTPPAPARILTMPTGVFLANTAVAPSVVGITNVSAALTDGTGATIRIWMFDTSQNLWVALGNSSARTTAAANLLNVQCGCTPGAQFFCQVIANTGVTKIAFFIH